MPGGVALMTVFGVLAATGIIGKVVEGSSQDKAQAGLKDLRPNQ